MGSILDLELNQLLYCDQNIWEFLAMLYQSEMVSGPIHASNINPNGVGGAKTYL